MSNSPNDSKHKNELKQQKTARKAKKTIDVIPNSEQEIAFTNKSINWIPAVVLLSTPFLALFFVPWYGIQYGFTSATWVVFAVFLVWSGLGITAGYHRLWSHKTYEASFIVRFVLLIGATLAVQSSIFDWCSGHRDHHKHVDDVYKDPYSAKRGFWFSHIGWMLKQYPSGQFNYKNIPDLMADPMLCMQHNHYHWWVFVTNILMPLAIGWMIGDMWGTLILAGLFRLVLTHHSTFFINSLAHIWGSQPYTDENTAKDNGILAFFTWGEGYHNYHHIFQYDYRNGIRWWQYDPTKWLIFTLSKLKLASGLKRVPNVKIQEAKLAMEFKHANMKVTQLSVSNEIQQLKQKLQTEYDAFTTTLEDWKVMKHQAVQQKIAEKKAHALLEKKAMEDKINQKLEQQKDNIEQIKQKMAESLSAKLSAVDAKFNEDVKQIEQRMQAHRKHIQDMLVQFKTDVKNA